MRAGTETGNFPDFQTFMIQDTEGGWGSLPLPMDPLERNLYR